jgi:Chalcone isomerase-like
MWRRSLLCLALVALAFPAGAGELAGVTLPDSVTVNGSKLVLNGLGLRKKAIFKVYVGALYLPERSSDPAAIIALDAPKRMVMHFVRSVGSGKIVDGWQEGFTANNSPAVVSAVKEKMDRFCALWTDMKDDDEAVMTYVPGTGTTLEIAGKELGVIPGKDFADALFAVWLGNEPPTEALKDGVLGK